MITQDRKPPILLQIVAYLFIFDGICAIIEMVISPFYGRFFFDFNIFCLRIGKGMLKANPKSREWALIFIYLGFLLIPAISWVLTDFSGTFYFKLFGIKIQEINPGVFICFAMGSLLLTFFELYVMYRADTRAFFKPIDPWAPIETEL
ncbi:MAG: hypothetical protein AAFR87_22460 [Bacteroidota bacterium]